jgi:hypothetical protein
MHALAMLHRSLSAHCPRLHGKRLTSLCAAAHAAVSGCPLTLRDPGRGLPGYQLERQCQSNTRRSRPV